MKQMGAIPLAYALLASQLVDSRLASTREYWRHKMGLPAHIVSDPRTLVEILCSSNVPL